MQAIAMLSFLFILLKSTFSLPATVEPRQFEQYPDGWTICHPPPFSQDKTLCALGFQATPDPEKVSLFLYDNLCVQLGEEIDIPAKMDRIFFRFTQITHPIILSTIKSPNGGGQYLPSFEYNGQKWGVGGKEVFGFGKLKESLSPSRLDTIEIKFPCQMTLEDMNAITPFSLIDWVASFIKTPFIGN